MSNETKHTPGPWEMRGERLVTDRHGVVIAEKIGANYPGTSEANARLIAAAPALLAALREVLPYVLMGSSGKTRHEFLENARAAIAQAEGSK